jgi:hypothetical protein
MIDPTREMDSGGYEKANNAGQESAKSGPRPSSGYLDEALQFIAAERAKLTFTCASPNPVSRKVGLTNAQSMQDEKLVEGTSTSHVASVSRVSPPTFGTMATT